MEFSKTESYFNLPAYVSQHFGLYMNKFELRRVRGNKMYPKCVDHIMSKNYIAMTDMDVKDNDHFFIIHLKSTEQPKQLPAHTELMVSSCAHGTIGKAVDKKEQTEDESAVCDVIKLNVHIFLYKMGKH